MVGEFAWPRPPLHRRKNQPQTRELEHVLFAGFTHPQAIVLAERLLSLLPRGYSRIFYPTTDRRRRSGFKNGFQVL